MPQGNLGDIYGLYRGQIGDIYGYWENGSYYIVATFDTTNTKAQTKPSKGAFRAYLIRVWRQGGVLFILRYYMTLIYLSIL